MISYPEKKDGDLLEPEDEPKLVPIEEEKEDLFGPGSEIGNYVVETVLQDSGWGVSFQARHRILGRKFMLKTFKHSSASRERMEKWFHQEIRVQSKINHPRVLKINDVVESKGILFAVSDYIEGESVQELMDREKKLDPVAAANICLSMCEALKACHDAGVTHRDVKPANYRIGRNDEFFLTDFGLSVAKEVEDTLVKGSIAGTPRFMSPEMARGEEVDTRADIYSLGSSLYYMLSGTNAFPGKTSVETIEKTQDGKATPISEVAEGISPELARITMKMLEKDREKRYQKVDAVMRDLEAFLDAASPRGRLVDGAQVSGNTLFSFTMPYSERGGASRYRVTGRIGGGGYGEVYRAEDLETGSTVALKFLRPGVSEESHTERFVREARKLAEIDHPNVVKVHALEESEEGRFYVMDFVPDGSLSERLKKGPMEPGEARTLFRKILSALGAIHELGIVHRDLKPANVLLRGDEPYLCDFGLAHFEGEATLTRSGEFLGTPCYTSPEMADERRSDHRSDLFSLGCILYEMVAGARPFSGPNAHAILYRIVAKPPDPYPAGLDVPPDLDAVLDRLLRKSPDDRFQSAREVLEVMG